MKHRSSNLHIADAAHRMHEKEERWVSKHVKLVAIVIACLITAAIVYLYLRAYGVEPPAFGRWPVGG